ncbi:1-aminocyclopropane-1-carboxylate synthase-like protein 1 [Stylophora pistillata]|uniref:1-aminocyclopropane-1-carboxylate synthase-like protein 1 n=1 Tax=Stylophora pistillata TaxID=50429 RepID=A0A2B4SQ80_STYPI|nr:1-aminocyclopropane-1-carboxylate synthase-like protein 1 [Stylophora pistillata]
MQTYTSLLDRYLTRLKANPYHNTKNPQGIIEMMTSENPLVFDLLKEKLIVSNGCTPIMDSLGYAIADAGVKPRGDQKGIFPQSDYHYIFKQKEGLLIPSPFHGAFMVDFQTRSRVVPFPVPLSSEIGPGETQPFELTVAKLESALKKATEQGVKIRGLLLCNPSNPLGTTYSEELLQDCLKFAARHCLHVIVDEVYMLCGFKEGCSVTNVLSLKNVPNKEMIHVMWGFSKDFGLSGFRCGVLHTLNKDVYQAISSGYSRFQDLPTPTQVLPTNTFEGEMELFNRLLDNGVALYPGAWFVCAEPGWFRLVFAMESEILQLGKL